MPRPGAWISEGFERCCGKKDCEQLAEGGVLVVGASATGTQIADELHRSGRPVTLAVGQPIRAPRLYRG
jgi:cation diffusion facilitator CzcD-associated flavoprotein CzcO